MGANKDMFINLIRVLDEARVPFCILAGYDDYPDSIASDVDFMVLPAWSDRMPALMAVTAARSGAHLIQCFRHETTAAYFVIARLEGSSVSYLHPDSSGDYRRHGRRWLDAVRIMHGRRRHRRGFWVPAAADAFAYYLIKKIDKGGVLEASHAAQLTRRYAEDPGGAARVLHTLLPQAQAQAIEEAANSESWATVPPLAQLRAALHARAPAETWGQRLRQAGADMRRLADRVGAPTGMHIVFLGPDGSGKSSIMSRVGCEMGRAFRRVHYKHLRPGLLTRARHLDTVDNPHAKPARGALGSVLKLFHFWLDFAIAAAFWLFPRKVRSTLVMFDRYYHDILADPLRYRYGGAPGLARRLGRLVPQPDIAFILDAPPEVLQRRKQEIPIAEGERQRAAYLALRSELRGACIIDASQPFDEVVAAVLGHIIAYLESRTARRLGVDNPFKRAVISGATI